MTDPDDQKPDLPERYLDVTELSVEQLIQREQARRKGEPEPRFERESYRIARATALREAGFEDESDPTEEPNNDPESWSVDDHLAQMRERNQ